MTLENLKRHHARLKWLASGEFTERDFDYTIAANENPNGEQGEKGWSTAGDFINKMGTKRKELIIGDAQRTLKLFEKKYPQFMTVEKPKPVKEEEKPKPKEKK